MTTHPLPAARPLDVTVVYAQHGRFVWATLQRMGARRADLDDLVQEVFVVVHRRAGDFDPTAGVMPWLFGICAKVAAAHRRRAYVRREQVTDEVPEGARNDAAPAQDPEAAAAAAQARARLATLLDEMDVEKRAVFVMFEVDGLTADAIAAMVGAPVGTVYSRLRAARQQFEQALARDRARDAARRGAR